MSISVWLGGIGEGDSSPQPDVPLPRAGPRAALSTLTETRGRSCPACYGSFLGWVRWHLVHRREAPETTVARVWCGRSRTPHDLPTRVGAVRL
jgi:hypothetical protein